MTGKTAKAQGPGRPKDLQKRAHILYVAGELFMKSGFDATTVDEIANAAGVAKLTVYNHFGDKERLFFEVIKSKTDIHTSEQFFKEFHGENPKRELLEIGCAFMDLVFSDEAVSMHRVIVAEGRKHPMLAVRFFEAAPDQLFLRLSQYLVRLQGKHPFHFKDPVKASKFFFGMLKGEAHLRAVLGLEPKESKENLRQYAKECVELFLNAHRVLEK